MAVEQYKYTRRKFHQVCKGYLRQMVYKSLTIEQVAEELQAKDIDREQVTEMLSMLQENFNIKRKKYLNECLDECISVLSLPTKWGITKDNNIVEMYPYPIMDNNYVLKKVVYI